jgi:maleylacetoacetate isomerase
MQIRLHSRFQNSAGERVRIVLNLKGIAYDYVVAPPTRSAAYRAINPQGLLPTLEIEGRFVAQSMAIVELIEELFPEPPILPSDRFERARMRAFAQHIAADLHPINNRRIRAYLSARMGQPEPAIQAWYHHWVAETFGALEADLARRPVAHDFCFADRPMLADACLVPQVANARRFDCDLSSFPLLTAIAERCRALPAFQAAAPEQQPDYRAEG